METALLNVVSDFRSCTDQDRGVILILLDLRAAINTMYYDILIGRLASRLVLNE